VKNEDVEISLARRKTKGVWATKGHRVVIKFPLTGRLIVATIASKSSKFAKFGQRTLFNLMVKVPDDKTSYSGFCSETKASIKTKGFIGFTFGLVLEVKSKSWPTRNKIPLIGDQIPEPTFGKDFHTLLQEGRHSDITFVVKGEEIKAHSLVLKARSKVFEKELSIGMREAAEQRVIIDDIESATFHAMLEFMYTDDFQAVEKMAAEARSAQDDGEDVKAEDGKGSAVGGGAYESADSLTKKRIALLQSLLQAAHRYQIVRLRAWCELQLCKCIVVGEVCSVFTQAHLYEAVELEQACLRFIKTHFHQVVMTAGFGTMTEEWPVLALRISIFMAGLSPASAHAAIKAQHQVRARRQPQEMCIEGGSSTAQSVDAAMAASSNSASASSGNASPASASSSKRKRGSFD
jgi:speckle-type POZ protein